MEKGCDKCVKCGRSVFPGTNTCYEHTERKQRDPHDGLKVVWESQDKKGGILKKEQGNAKPRYYFDVYIGNIRAVFSFDELKDLHKVIGEEIKGEER